MVGLPNIESIDKDEAEKDKQSVPDAFQFLNLEGLTTNEINRISDILGVKALLPETEEKTPELGDAEGKESVKDLIKRGADPKDIILNLPSVVSSLTTDIMKQSAIDEAAVRKVFAGGDDATEGDMEAVAAGGDTEILGKGGGRKVKTERG